MDTKRQHKGLTGHHYVKGAVPAISRAGIGHVFYDDSTLLDLTDDGRLVVCEAVGQPVILRLSARDAREMKRLQAAAAAMMASTLAAESNNK